MFLGLYYTHDRIAFYIDNPYVLYINLYTGFQVYAITPRYKAITILLDTISLSISYMVVVKQIAPVGFPTGACLLKRFSNFINIVLRLFYYKDYSVSV